MTANIARADLPDIVPAEMPWITWVTGAKVPASRGRSPREHYLNHRGATPRMTDNRMEQRSVPAKTIGIDARARIHVGTVREQPVENLLFSEIDREV